MNLFWPTYKRLENEMVALTSEIRFDDNQMKVYSDKLLELLIRISVEIEAISKELYLTNGGKPTEHEEDMYFDTVCLQYLEEKWNLGKKAVLIDGYGIAFGEENKLITPLYKANKRGSSGSKWKQGYQAVKHNRVKNYEKGNIWNCINALAALFILNIYYRNETYNLTSLSEANSFDDTLGSKLFRIIISKWEQFSGAMTVDEQSIYCINYTKDFIEKWNKKLIDLNFHLYQEILKDRAMLDAINSGDFQLKELSNNEKVQKIIGSKRFVEILKNVSAKNNIGTVVNNQEFRAYLNKEC